MVKFKAIEICLSAHLQSWMALARIFNNNTVRTGGKLAERERRFTDPGGNS
jgi:hypothetical protein